MYLLRSIGSYDIAFLLESITTKKCQEHFNYERLEFIGDAILKYVASSYIYWSHPFASEGLLTNERKVLVSNTKLAEACVENGLHKYIRHERLGDHPWRPAGCQFLDNFWDMIGDDPNTGSTWASSSRHAHGKGRGQNSFGCNSGPTQLDPLVSVAQAIETVSRKMFNLILRPSPMW